MGWLSGWQYRKSHEIEGSSAGGQTDYQIKIIVHKGTGTDSGENIYCNNHCRNNFGDIRFTKSDGTTLLDYWMESYTSGDKATFWVEVPSIPASPDKATIYIYYGKSDATTTSNGKNTFPIFYDFGSDESDEWTLDAGQWQWDTTNGWLRTGGASGQTRARVKDVTVSTGHAIRMKIKWAPSEPFVGNCFAYQDSSNFYHHRLSTFTSYAHSMYRFSTALGNGYIFYESYSTSTDTWYILETRWISSTKVLCYINDELAETVTSGLVSDWTSGDVGIRSYHYSTSDYGYYDWFLIRKCVDPEPSHGSWGSEEQSGATEVAITDSATGIEALSRLYRGLNLTDIATSQESFSRPYRQLQIPEQASSLELLLKTRNLNLGDIAASLETIERARQIGAITDTAQSLEQILKQRFTSLLDAAAGGETIARPTRMTILADEALSQEILSKLRELTAITDSAIGIEYVNVGAEGAIKTMIFLLIGDLAIQISGD